MKLWTYVSCTLSVVVPALVTLSTLHAQDVAMIKVPDVPLVLKSRGSFFIGGKSVEETPTELSSIFGKPLNANGHVTIDQMYVDFMVPQNVHGVPVIMMHGGTVTGKTYDTTPDGRMGWYEYFVRQGYPTYVPDGATRGRSGVDIADYNDVRLEAKAPETLPHAFRESDEYNWMMFRFGPRPGQSYPDSQFPASYAAELSKQGVPDFNAMLESPNSNALALSTLAHKLHGAVILAHSEGGSLPIDATLADDSGVRGLVLVEPGTCESRQLNDGQIEMLARHPILVVFGDHLGTDTGTPGFTWAGARSDCETMIARVNKVGGQASLIWPPALGIHGNSHLMMMDRNNLQIADLILRWINEKVDKASSRRK
ncbi:alpha/beta hydrolase family protein [Gluconobacter kanchanaburiensis]|uniref:Esterase n=1 Tax=Gluconobacter kanchanaburiensis NBRC 103587 TaxID=1307948 RepID=A0A511BHU2_9PROT|nr:hypothetical protein [Gluconobacter kanchanaburiensis]MBF0863000.1 hypothetical protein [Gluconobacter kanchanaburiensis]GEK97377.1 esterase [Gluconobacter kanchanaburiensis NBRC 103587]